MSIVRTNALWYKIVMTKRSELNFPAIYTITHIASGKTYVGQTINVCVRWQLHRSDLRKGKHRNAYLQNAWNKYGKDAFKFSVYCNLSDIPQEQLASELNRMEIQLLETIEEPYNLMRAGVSGVVASAETRALLSRIHLAHWQNPDRRERHRNSLLELYADPEWKAARDAAMKEAKGSKENREAVSAHMTALWQTPEHRANQTANMNANWSDPEYRAKQSASRAATWADPVVRARRAAGIAAAHARRREAKLAAQSP